MEVGRKEREVGFGQVCNGLYRHLRSVRSRVGRMLHGFDGIPMAEGVWFYPETALRRVRLVEIERRRRGRYGRATSCAPASRSSARGPGRGLVGPGP